MASRNKGSKTQKTFARCSVCDGEYQQIRMLLLVSKKKTQKWQCTNCLSLFAVKPTIVSSPMKPE